MVILKLITFIDLNCKQASTLIMIKPRNLGFGVAISMCAIGKKDQK